MHRTQEFSKYIDISGGFKVVVWSKLYDLVFVPLIYAKLDIHLN
jgi:hypothetical protein